MKHLAILTLLLLGTGCANTSWQDVRHAMGEGLRGAAAGYEGQQRQNNHNEHMWQLDRINNNINNSYR